MNLQTLIHKIKQIYYSQIRQSKQSSFVLQIPLRHYLIIFCILLSLCFVNLFMKYQTFLAMKKGSVFEATILLHYTKKENSERFKLQDSQGNVFYTTYRGKFKPLAGKKALVYGKIYRCSFLRFLRSCNIYNSSLSLIPSLDKKLALRKFINNQHDNKLYEGDINNTNDKNLAANLYNALFFADNLEKPLRQSSIALGLAHIIAISGFHLAVLSFMFYVLICPFYFLFHGFFCYRNAVYDLGFLVLIFVYCYLVLIDFEPSFLRAFLMACFGYLILFCGLQITNFLNLLLCVLFALSWNMSLLFHIGFLLSVAGVFCIFLFIRHIGTLLRGYNKLQKILIGVILFDCIIFLQMMPIVHYFFPQFSPYQLVSIPLSICFAFIFPLLVILHVFGFGGVFDSVILQVVAHDFIVSSIYTPLWFLAIYILLCFLAMRFLWAYLASIACACVFYCISLAVFLR